MFGFPWNLVLETFMNVRWGTPNLVGVGRKRRGHKFAIKAFSARHSIFLYCWQLTCNSTRNPLLRFILQKWLRKRCTILRYPYLAFFVLWSLSTSKQTKGQKLYSTIRALYTSRLCSLHKLWSWWGSDVWNTNRHKELIRIVVSVLTFKLLMSYIYMEHPFLMFLDHTQRRSTVSRTPLDKWSVRRRDLYLTTHDTHSR